MDYITLEKYRQLFNDHIEQALDYVKNLKEEDFKAKVCLKKELPVLFRFSSRRLIRSLSCYQLYVNYAQQHGINVWNK